MLYKISKLQVLSQSFIKKKTENRLYSKIYINFLCLLFYEKTTLYIFIHSYEHLVNYIQSLLR